MASLGKTRVVATGKTGCTRTEEHALPPLAPGEALLRVLVSGLCGTDLFKLRYAYPPPGKVLGHEIVAQVVEVASDHAHVAPGDRIVLPHHVPCGACALCASGHEPMCLEFAENHFSPGGFAHDLVAGRPAVAAAHRVPDSLSNEAAVFFEPLACVVRAIRRSGLLDRAGTTEAVGIQGGGSMGLLHLLALKALLPNAKPVLIEPREDRRALAESLGAVARPPGVSAARESPPLAVLFDTVGGIEAVAWALELLAPGGTIVLFAHGHPRDSASFPFNPFFKAEHNLVASYSSAPEDQELSFLLLDQERLDPRPVATHRLSLDQFQEGVDLALGLDALKVLFYPGGAP